MEKADKIKKTYKLCFYILCAGIFADFAVKFNLYDFNGDFFIQMGIELFILVTVFLFHIFMLAKSGILFGMGGTMTEHFPLRRYALISLYFAAAMVFSAFIIRVITNISHNMLYEAVNAGYIILFVFLAVYITLLTVFYTAFRIARKAFKTDGK
jgi:hypothetical protein